MTTKARIITLLFTGMLSLTAGGAHGFTIPSQDASRPTAIQASHLAWLSEDEKSLLRQQWQNLAPDERERLRRKLRDDRGDSAEDGYGLGFEFRRRDSDDSQSSDSDKRWGKSRSRDEHKGRR
jgi:hypothetical protein